eukprot:COSAG06_NODE_6817_length_2763_cov_228.529279_6_plen_135_part_00
MTTSHGSEARIKVSSSRSPRGSLCGAGWAWMMARACKQAGRLGAGRAPCAAAAFRLVRATSGEPSIEKFRESGAIEAARGQMYVLFWRHMENHRPTSRRAAATTMLLAALRVTEFVDIRSSQTARSGTEQRLPL